MVPEVPFLTVSLKVMEAVKEVAKLVAPFAGDKAKIVGGVTSPTATSYARRQAAANELRDTLNTYFPND